MIIAINLLGMNPEQGGMYQYAVTFTKHLLARDTSNTYVLFHDYDGILDNGFDLARTTTIAVRNPLRLGLTVDARKIWTPRSAFAQGVLRRVRSSGLIGNRFLRGDYGIFSAHGAGLLIQPSHVTTDAVLSGLPYLIAIHDAPWQWSAEHRKTRSPRFLAWYDSLIRELARSATMILVDSPNGRDAMINGYGVHGDRIRILPFRPPGYIGDAGDAARRTAVAARFQLPERFLFFPSKFHAHKNHLGLLEALAILKNRYGVEVPVVLVGSTSTDDTHDRVIQRMKELGVSGQVRVLGYVSDDDMAALYTLALALVFPTLMGPTAIPILEAFALGCPVICSNAEGFPEQIGDAGLLVDPNSPHDIARAIQAIAGSASLRDELRAKGKRRFRELTATDYAEEIHTIVQGLVAKVEARA